jgi:hypothetical protein
MDSYLRRVLLGMLTYDLGASDAPWTPFGPEFFKRFQDSYNRGATHR